MALRKIWFYKLNWKSWDFVVTMAVACKKKQKYTMPEIQAKKLLMLIAHLIPDINGISIMFWYLTMCLLGRKADQKKNLRQSLYFSKTSSGNWTHRKDYVWILKNQLHQLWKQKFVGN